MVFRSTDNHAFSLAEGDRGETDWSEMHINTGDAVPKKQPVAV